jgi:GDP-L-galactose phosphorylase
MVFKSQEDYDEATEDFAWRLLSEVSLSEERFMEVAQMCFGACTSTAGASAAVGAVGGGGRRSMEMVEMVTEAVTVMVA